MLEILAPLVCAAILFWVIRLAIWARRNPDPLYGVEDPETGLSESERMDGIR